MLQHLPRSHDHDRQGPRPGLCSLDWVSEIVAHTPAQGVGVGGGGAATSRQKGGGGGWGAPSWASGLGGAEGSGEKISPAAAENWRRLCLHFFTQKMRSGRGGASPITRRRCRRCPGRGTARQAGRPAHLAQVTRRLRFLRTRCYPPIVAVAAARRQPGECKFGFRDAFCRPPHARNLSLLGLGRGRGWGGGGWCPAQPPPEGVGVGGGACRAVCATTSPTQSREHNPARDDVGCWCEDVFWSSCPSPRHRRHREVSGPEPRPVAPLGAVM